MNLYLPQFYKENYHYVQMATHLLSNEAIETIRIKERKNIAALLKRNHTQIKALLSIMENEEISENYKVVSLRKELNQYHHTEVFSQYKTMGGLVKQQLQQLAG